MIHPDNIQERLRDAVVLHRAERYEGALVMAFVAAHAAAGMRFPKGTSSPTRKDKKTGEPSPMSGGEAFELFLREEFPKNRLPRLNVRVGLRTEPVPLPPDPLALSSGELDTAFKKHDQEWKEYANKTTQPIEKVLWELGRNKLDHTGGLGEHLKFVGPPERFSVEVTEGGTVILSYGWIAALINVVSNFLKDFPDPAAPTA